MLIFSFFLTIFISLLYAVHNPNGFILRYDALFYLIKSLEITLGDLTPIKTHALGLSLTIAPFFYFFKSSSLFVNMLYAQFISTLLSGLIIFPLYAVCRKVLDNKSVLIVLSLFPLSYWLMYSSVGFWSEPLFTILLLLSLYYIYKSKENPNYIFLSATFASLSYWVRPNGIILLPVVLISGFFLRKEINFNLYKALGVILIFFAVATPFLYQRYLYFGSLFFYGENNKYWIDTYEQLWGANYSSPSFFEFFKSHSTLELTDRFLVKGLGGIVFGFISFMLPLTIFSLWGIISSFKKREFTPLIILSAVYLLSFVPIFGVFYTGRYLFPIIPLGIIFSAVGLQNIASRFSKPYLFKTLAILLTIPFLLVGFVYPAYYYQNSSNNYAEKIKFGRWIANNIRGKIAMGYDWDFVMMNLPDAKAGRQSLFHVIAPKTGIEIIYPGYFESTDKALKWFRDNKITHFIISQSFSAVSPPLRIFPANQIEKDNRFEKIFPEVYKINYEN